MQKEDIIKSLCMQNEYLKADRDKWQELYATLLQKYNDLLEATKKEKNMDHILGEHQQHAQYHHKLMHTDTQLLDFQTPLVTTEASPTVSPEKGETELTMKRNKSQEDRKANNQLRAETKEMVRKATADQFDFFAKDQMKPPELDKKLCQLIEGCFIIEKNSSIDHFDPVRLMHPMVKYINLRSMFDIIYRYVFVNDQLFEIDDDEFDSRKNQIMFGTPSEEFQFVFDNLNQSNEGEKGRLNSFQRQTNLMRKRYVYGIVIPQIVQHENQSYQTELAYGFLSHVPFPNFFKDLNRIVQQQVKFKMLNMQKNSIKKSEKLEIIEQTITHITNRSLERKLVIKNYPINLELKANICGLKLVYTNKNSYISDQLLNVEHLIQKFSLEKVFKLLHYILTQHSIIIVCRNRKKLNRAFEIIRNIIYPFNWIFPIIYFYSPFFQPFLSSPLPILVGHIENKDPEEDEGQNSFNDQKLPCNQFVKIYLEDDHKKDENEIEDFEKRIKHNYKKIFKDKKTKSHWKPFGGSDEKEKHLNKLSDKPLAERTTTKLFEYVKRLKTFVQTGKIDEEMDDFLIQFMETQMVSYFKQSRKE